MGLGWQKKNLCCIWLYLTKNQDIRNLEIIYKVVAVKGLEVRLPTRGCDEWERRNKHKWPRA